MEEPFEISIDEPLREFREHIAPEYNKRIIFSAPFGTGKTYFLDQYFNHHEKDEYNSFFLYPVNYSVSSNEDVFELIKFDILFQLLENEELQLQPNDFEDLFIAQNYLYSKVDNILEWILRQSGKINKNVIKIANALKKIETEYKKYNEFKTAATENIDLARALQFIQKVRGESSHAYEEDAITHLIQRFLEQLSEKKGKKNILIIDDLDRIDPEHIFRLLNVFAAHFDIGQIHTTNTDRLNNNKFGFDKAMFVCDINNVRNIFHSKYGMETDFTGYIDKFYSVDIFYFDNSNKIIEYIEKKLINSFYQKNPNDNSFLAINIRNSDFRELLIYTWQTLYKYNALNIRSLKRIFDNKLKLVKYELKLKGYDYKIYNHHSLIVILFDILKFNYGSYPLALKALEKASTRTETIPHDKTMYPNLSKFYSHVMPIITHNHFFEQENKGLTTYHNEKFNANFTVESPKHINGIIYSVTTGPLSLDNFNNNKQQVNRIQKINFFTLLIEAFKTLQLIGHLKD